MSKVGFVGLGIMGTPMAAHLIAGGHQLFLYDHKPPRPELVDKGGLECASAKEVAQRADIIVIMVPDTPDVATVLFAENGVAAGLAKGLTLDAAALEAKTYVTEAIAAADRLAVGSGNGPVHHFHKWW